MDLGASFFQLEQRRDEIDAMRRIASGRINARRASRKQQMSIFESRQQAHLEDVIEQNEQADERNSKLLAEIQNMHYTLRETKRRDWMLKKDLRAFGFTRPSALPMAECTPSSFTIHTSPQSREQMRPRRHATTSVGTLVEHSAFSGVANPGVCTREDSMMEYAPRHSVTISTQTSPKVATLTGLDDTRALLCGAAPTAVAASYTNRTPMAQQRTSAAHVTPPTEGGGSKVIVPPSAKSSGHHSTVNPRLPCDRPRAPSPNSRGHETYNRLRLFEREMQADLTMLQSLSTHASTQAIMPSCVEQKEQFPYRGPIGVSREPPTFTVDFLSRTQLPPKRAPLASSATNVAMERRLLNASSSAYDRATGDVDDSHNAPFAPVGTTCAAPTLDARLTEWADARLVTQSALFHPKNKDSEQAHVYSSVGQSIVTARDSSTVASRVTPSVWNNMMSETRFGMNNTKHDGAMNAEHNDMHARSTALGVDDAAGMSEHEVPPAVGEYCFPHVSVAQDTAAPSEGAMKSSLLGSGHEGQPASTQNNVADAVSEMQPKGNESPRFPSKSSSGCLGLSGGEKNTSCMSSDSVGGLLEMMGEEKLSEVSSRESVKEHGKEAPSARLGCAYGGALGPLNGYAATPGRHTLSSTSPVPAAKHQSVVGTDSVSVACDTTQQKPSASDSRVATPRGCVNSKELPPPSTHDPQGSPCPAAGPVNATQPPTRAERDARDVGSPHTRDSDMPRPPTHPARDDSPAVSSAASLPIDRQETRTAPLPSGARRLCGAANSTVRATKSVPSLSNETRSGQQSARLQKPEENAHASEVEEALWREFEDIKPKDEMQSVAASAPSSAPPMERRVKMKSNPLRSTGLMLGSGPVIASLRPKSSADDGFIPAFSSDALKKLRPKQQAKATSKIDFTKGKFPED